MTKVSVVLPVFNGGATVERAVRSILDQSFTDLELIVVDDGSTDDTLLRLRSFKDPRLRVIEQPHRGVTAAANTATAVATASYIARMDADDVSHPERLETQLRFLCDGDFDAVGCCVRILDACGSAVPSLQRYEAWINDETANAVDILALRFVEYPLVNPTILAKRHFFELGYRNGDFPEDYDLMLRAAQRQQRFGKVQHVLFDWHDSENRLTRRDGRYSPEGFERCRREHLLRGPLKDVDEVDLWGLGNTGKPWLRWLQERGIHVRHGYDIDERKVGVKIHGVETAHPRDLPPADGTPILVAVGAEGARDVIRPQLESGGYTAGGDAWFVA